MSGVIETEARSDAHRELETLERSSEGLSELLKELSRFNIFVENKLEMSSFIGQVVSNGSSGSAAFGRLRHFPYFHPEISGT